MAFIDVQTPYATAAGSMSAQVGGAPQGGGISYSAPAPAPGQPGGGAPGTNASLKTWVIAFFVIDAAILITAGVIFNGKG